MFNLCIDRLVKNFFEFRKPKTIKYRETWELAIHIGTVRWVDIFIDNWAGTMTQMFGAGETECSVIMFWAYAFASVALTLWSTFFMWLVG